MSEYNLFTDARALAHLGPFLDLLQKGQALNAHGGVKVLADSTNIDLAQGLDSLSSFCLSYHGMMMQIAKITPWEDHSLVKNGFSHNAAPLEALSALKAEEKRLNSAFRKLSDSEDQRALLYFFFAKYALNSLDGFRVFLWSSRCLDALMTAYPKIKQQKLVGELQSAILEALDLFKPPFLQGRNLPGYEIFQGLCDTLTATLGECPFKATEHLCPDLRELDRRLYLVHLGSL